MSDGIWRRVRPVNDLGDLLRYLSFAVVAGNVWAYLVLALVLRGWLPAPGRMERLIWRYDASGRRVAYP